MGQSLPCKLPSPVSVSRWTEVHCGHLFGKYFDRERRNSDRGEIFSFINFIKSHRNLVYKMITLYKLSKSIGAEDNRTVGPSALPWHGFHHAILAFPFIKTNPLTYTSWTIRFCCTNKHIDFQTCIYNILLTFIVLHTASFFQLLHDRKHSSWW